MKFLHEQVGSECKSEIFIPIAETMLYMYGLFYVVIIFCLLISGNLELVTMENSKNMFGL